MHVIDVLLQMRVMRERVRGRGTCDAILRLVHGWALRWRVGDHGVVHGHRHHLMCVEVRERGAALLLHLVERRRCHVVHVFEALQIGQVVVVAGLLSRELVERATSRVHEEVGDRRHLQLELLGDGGLHVLRRALRLAEDCHERASLDVGEDEARLLGAGHLVLDDVIFSLTRCNELEQDARRVAISNKMD